MFSRAAQGIITDLYTNIPAIVRKHPDVFLAGEAGSAFSCVTARLRLKKWCGEWWRPLK
ncbi:MAG: hypothetical protein FGF53_05640 [Candidatus Brockarchaeota archaeon]|nr:hypothetical protein [Candidatus Brockarchaeota archaeon]MBO3808535.1 hypothetical protein [Candidatus Brockarchaeota archaeon]